METAVYPDNEKIPPRMRPHAFAANELLLDVLYVARQLADVDLESLLIYMCVSEALYVRQRGDDAAHAA
jgi:hypothetical protein